MTRNPWGVSGVSARLDKVELTGPSMIDGEVVDVESSTPGHVVLLLESLRDAVFNYLYWGLGRNGTSAPEFWHATEFLFHVRASRPETWQGARVFRELVEDGHRVRRQRVFTLTDDELKAGCLDTWWDLFRKMPTLTNFTRRLLEKRQGIVRQNWLQITHVPDFDAALFAALTLPLAPDEFSAALVQLDRRRRQADASFSDVEVPLAVVAAHQAAMMAS